MSIRLYNNKKFYLTTKKYYEIQSHKEPILNFPEKSSKVSSENKKDGYNRGKLILPNKIFNKYIGKEYYKIKLTKPVKYLANFMSLSGSAYLLFFPEEYYHSQIIRFDIQKEQFNLVRTKKSKLLIHSRKTNGKKYCSGKIYLPKSLVGKRIFFVSVVNSCSELYFDRDNQYYGKAFFCFYEDDIKLEDSTTEHKKSYEITLNLIKNNKISSIAKKRNLAKDTIWSHVIQSFNNKLLDEETFRSIIRKNISEKIRIEVISELEKYHQRKENTKLFFEKNIARNKRRHYVKPSIPIKEFIKRFNSKYSINMIGAIIIASGLNDLIYFPASLYQKKK